MLEFIRKYSGSPAIKFFLGLLAFTFVFCFGIMDVIRKYTGKDYLVKIGSVKITPTLFRLEKAKKIQMLRAAKKNIDEKAEVSNILGSIISENVVDLAASDFGFVVSDDSIKTYINGMYMFRDENGYFRKDMLRLFLQTVGISENMFIELSRKDIKSALIKFPFVYVCTINEQHYYTKAMMEKRNIAMVRLRPKSFMMTENPTKEQLEEFYAENPDLFSAEEHRSFRIFELKESDLEKKIVVSEEEKKDYYEVYADKDSKSYEESQQEIAEELRQEKLRKLTDEVIRDLEDSIISGTSIDEVVQKFNLNVITAKNIDIQGESSEKKSSLPKYGKDAATIAFSIDDGADSAVSESIGDDDKKVFWFVHVDEVVPKHVEEFAKISEKVEEEWTLRRQIELARETAQSLVEQIKSGAKLSQLLSKKGYAIIVTPLFDREGKIPDGKGNFKFPNVIAALHTTVFQKLKNDADYAEIDDTFVVYQVNDIVYPDDISQDDENKYHSSLIHEFANDMYTQLVGYLSKERYEVKINHEMLNDSREGFDVNQLDEMF
ncbi:MAG: SurA N-terminal domain-containing protein [Holosporaceae bacterium]|nr:SurA N-terminal domain-containing protein [Holosporaceae bacterium]